MKPNGPSIAGLPSVQRRSENALLYLQDVAATQVVPNVYTRDCRRKQRSVRLVSMQHIRFDRTKRRLVLPVVRSKMPPPIRDGAITPNKRHFPPQHAKTSTTQTPQAKT
jgi:hypothetical protein